MRSLGQLLGSPFKGKAVDLSPQQVKKLPVPSAPPNDAGDGKW